MIKTRTKSIEAYTEAGRSDLVDQEVMEINFIKVYLPKRVSVDIIRESALETKSVLNADSMRFMGEMMNILKEKFGVSAKASDISRIVKEILS